MIKWEEVDTLPRKVVRVTGDKTMLRQLRDALTEGLEQGKGTYVGPWENGVVFMTVVVKQ